MASQNQQMTVIKKEQEVALLDYVSKAQNLMINQFSIRSSLETVDRYYMREDDKTVEQSRLRTANRLGDKTKIQDVTVPIVMPQVQSALAYMVNVFASGYPIFGVAAEPALEDAALQFETIIAENCNTAGWVRQLIMFFRDGLKYNLHGMEVDWQQKTVYGVETDLNFPNSAKPKKQLWEGNAMRRMDMYNTFFDPRVHPAEIHSEGEFAGYIDIYSRIRFKKMMNELFGKVRPSVIERALNSAMPSTSGVGGTPFGYYIPIINSRPLLDQRNVTGTDWMAWAAGMQNKAGTIQYHNAYQVTKVYARILPADFDFAVPEANTPQVWKFLIVNGSVVIYAERMSNAHNFIPIFFGQPLEDGLDYQTKSFANNVEDMQDVASAMWNGYLASKRRLIGDRVLYDPLRVASKDINSTNPSAKIPVRPAAFGKDVKEAVFQFPFRDEQTQTLLDGAERVNKFANLMNGQNPAQQGQFVKGNKTRHEYEDIMGHGNAQNMLMALMSEAQVFTPIKEVIKLNILQYQGDTVLYNQEQGAQIKVNTTDLRKAAVQFKISDGIQPLDKIMAGEEWQTALQVMGTSPAIAASYNMGPMFSYVMKQRGVDLRPFEKPQVQVMYEQQVMAWQQAAAEAAKKGVEFKAPMPQIPPELQQQGKQTQQVQQSATGKALEATQGTGNAGT
jgi:hypothetical protein